MTNDNRTALLDRIKNGERVFGPEYETQLDKLEEGGYIVIIQKHRESTTGERTIDRILVRPTE
jgi:hypothetical protein